MILRTSLSGERQEFSETLREVLRVEHVRGATQGRGRDGVGSWGAAYAEVDAARVQGCQDPEGLGHLERGVVGEHDPPGPTLILFVTPATCPIMISGVELATLGRLWCSASQ
jgi:hypothetical protein